MAGGASTDGNIPISSPETGPGAGSDSPPASDTSNTGDDRKDSGRTAGGQRSSHSPLLRRLACDACRNRKVRCDRQSPSCSRCVKIGNNCHYSSRARSTPSKMDLSKFLLTMNNRLQQAEAQLAMSPAIPSWKHLDVEMETETTSPAEPNTPVYLPSGVSVSSPHPAPALFRPDGIMALSAYPDPPEWSTSTDSGSSSDTSGTATNFQFDDFSLVSSDYTLAQTTPEDVKTGGFDLDPMFFDFSTSSVVQAVPPLTSESGRQGLYKRYFDIFHPAMPIVNRSRFLAETAQAFPPVEAQVLSYAIACLGAVSIPGLDDHADRCYHHARHLLEVCEQQDHGGSLASLNTLQAYTLLTLFELKRPNLARAWMTLGRATRLAKMLGLEELDSDGSRPEGWLEGWGVPARLPAASGPGDVEERRRTFWLLYALDALAALKVNADPAFNGPISVHLASPTEYPDESTAGYNMPSLQHVFDLSERPSLSAFSGMAIMISLYQQWLQHTSTAAEASSYPFWENHYRLDKDIGHCRTGLLAGHLEGDEADGDAASLVLRTSLAAVEIHLHEAALARARRDELPAGVAAEALSRLTLAADDVAEAVRLGRSLPAGRARETLRQAGGFLLAWPVATALRVLCCPRALRLDGLDAAPCPGSLRALAGAARDLVGVGPGPGRVDPCLLREADARVAEAERSARRGYGDE